MMKDTQIVETISGTWLRFPNSFKKFHCLIELPSQLSLNINLKSGSVHVHKKDENNVYQPFGELSITTSGSQLQCIVRAIQGLDANELLVRQSDAS